MNFEFTPEMLALGAIWYIVFLFSLTCHEGAHALAAKWGGDPTASLAGQVTLNPLPHIQREPLGTTVVPLVSYLFAGWMIGWASAPYDPYWQLRYPRRAALMALAGPAANFLLMLVASAGIRLGMALGYFHAPERVSFTGITEAAEPGLAGFFAIFFSILFVLNLLLGTFNLLPVPPLDGNTAITLLMSKPAALRFLDWTQNSGFGLMGLLVAWLVYGRMFRYIFIVALNALYPGAGYG
jgi:Zn-dependent protease